MLVFKSKFMMIREVFFKGLLRSALFIVLWTKENEKKETTHFKPFKRLIL